MNLFDYLETYQEPPNAAFRANNAGEICNFDHLFQENLKPTAELLDTGAPLLRKETLPEWLAITANDILAMTLADRFQILAGSTPRTHHLNKGRNWHQVEKEPNPTQQPGFWFDERIAKGIATVTNAGSTQEKKIIAFIERILPEIIHRAALFKTEKSYKAKQRMFQKTDFEIRANPNLKQTEAFSQQTQAADRAAIGAEEKPQKLKELVKGARHRLGIPATK
jgi:hypothetical protein